VPAAGSVLLLWGDERRHDGRPALTASLRHRFPCERTMTKRTVTNIFYAGEERGVMCRVDPQGVADRPILLVAPLMQLAFDRSHPIAQDMTGVTIGQ
jgi:hypothetical protein